MTFGVNDDFAGSVAIPPGSNLTTAGSYRDQIAAVIPNFPSLQYTHGLRADHSRYHTSSLAAVFNFAAGVDEALNYQPRMVTDSRNLRHILQSRTEDGVEAVGRELIVLEGLQPDFIAVIGELWQMPPSMIKRHMFAGMRSTDKNTASYHAIPSAIDPMSNLDFQLLGDDLLR